MIREVEAVLDSVWSALLDRASYGRTPEHAMQAAADALKHSLMRIAVRELERPKGMPTGTTPRKPLEYAPCLGLARLRMDRGMSTTRAAAEFGLRGHTWARWEKMGRARKERLEAIAKRWGVTLKEIGRQR